MATEKQQSAADRVGRAIAELNAALDQAAEAALVVRVDYIEMESMRAQEPVRVYSATCLARV